MLTHKKPFVSVVIPTLNEEKYLPRCLESFKKQTYKNFEIVISDGNSTDNTAHIAKQFQAKIVINPHPTIPSARQKGVETSRGDIIVGADADTYYPTTHIAYIVEDFLKDPDIVAVGGGARFPKHPWWVHLGWKTVYSMSSILSKLGIVGYFPAFNFSFRKRAFDKIGGYNTYIDYGGDELDLRNRLEKVGKIMYDSRLSPLSSNRRSKVGFFRFVFKEGLFDYYVGYVMAKLFKRTVIKGKPVR